MFSKTYTINEHLSIFVKGAAHERHSDCCRGIHPDDKNPLHSQHFDRCETVLVCCTKQFGRIWAFSNHDRIFFFFAVEANLTSGKSATKWLLYHLSFFHKVKQWFSTPFLFVSKSTNMWVPITHPTSSPKFWNTLREGNSHKVENPWTRA